VRLLGFRRHPVSEEELSAYLDDRLSARAKGRVDAHLQLCVDCCRKLEEMRVLVAEMRRISGAKIPRSFALSPELAAAARREGDRARQQERVAFRRAYLGLSGATVAAALLLIAVVGSDVVFFSRGGKGTESTGGGVALSRQAATTSAEDKSTQLGAIRQSAGEGQEGAVPGVAPPLPSAAAPDNRFSAGATPPAATPYGEAAAAPQQAQPAAEGSSHLWLWVLEGAAGGLIIGFGVSAFWMRRRWVEINRSK
jgi:hypothetical protein